MSGLPDVDAASTYGLPFSDYAPVEDPTTDLASALFNLVGMNVAGMTQTACRAWVAFVGNASSPTDPTSFVHGAVWGNGLSVKPTDARTGTGVYTFTWPATVTDALGVVHSVNLRRCWWNVEGTTPYMLTATVTSPNVVTVRVFNAAGSANDGVGTTFTVYAL